MNELLFFSSFIILSVIFFSRHKIVEYLFEELDISIESEIIVYILSILFIAMILMGMLLDNTKEKYSEISQNYDKLRPKQDDGKPHRYFDINFDIFK